MRTLVAVLLLVAISGHLSLIEAGPKSFLNVKEVFDTAKSLESAELLQENISSDLVQKRTLAQYNYARVPKSAYAEEQLEASNKVANEFKFKAYEYVQDNKKDRRGWFTNIKNALGPMVSMRNIANKYPFLQEVNQRYEEQGQSGSLTNEDVDCDLVKFKLTQLHNTYFVLQTDIKYLVIGDQHILNRAIYEQLKADRFASAHNFYETVELNQKQKSLLESYYADHVNMLVTNFGNSIDHFHNPGEFIVGRILDSCQAVNQHASLWDELEANRLESCSKSSSDPNQKHFVNFYNRSKYEDIFALCKGLFEAM